PGEGLTTPGPVSSRPRALQALEVAGLEVEAVARRAVQGDDGEAVAGELDLDVDDEARVDVAVRPPVSAAGVHTRGNRAGGRLGGADRDGHVVRAVVVELERSLDRPEHPGEGGRRRDVA